METPTHRRASIGWPARNYLHQLCAHTGYSLENLSGAMDDRNGWREKESGKSMLVAQPDDKLLPIDTKIIFALSWSFSLAHLTQPPFYRHHFLLQFHLYYAHLYHLSWFHIQFYSNVFPLFIFFIHISVIHCNTHNISADTFFSLLLVFHVRL